MIKTGPIHVTLVCLFCGANLKEPDVASYSSSDLIKCQECGEHNDYDGVVNVAKEKGIAQITKDAKTHLKNEIRHIFGKKR